jgi:PTH1 family peptidyl-tRNA hydrolase
MWVLVGLGNPGPKYDNTPHNVGFALADRLIQVSAGATPLSPGSWKTESKSLTQKITVAGEPLLVVKPQTFMNLSGEAVQSLMAFYKLPPKNVVVVVDDVYLDIGSIRIRMQGGHGGHNGLRNIIEHCGDAFTRIRIGVGPCPIPDKAAFVLRKYQPEEEKALAPVFAGFPKLVETGLAKGWERAATDFNKVTPRESKE